MLSISPIRQSKGRHGVRYYLDVVANSRDDYYAGRGEAPGQWLGGGSATLGLSGTVEASQYLAVMYGRAPDGKTPLSERPCGRKVLGWDLTFSAPKSVSLLWAMADAPVRVTLRQAHDRAVAQTMAWLEAEAARARRGHAGKLLHDVDGFVAAAFRHRTSRAGDPQLHTHVVVANAVRSIEDGRWSGLDSRGVYGLKMAGGAVYRSALRAALAPLGLQWQVRGNGLSEVADIHPALLRAFSTQRQKIEAHLAERGLSSPVAANIAAHQVRPPKDPALASAPDGVLHERWRAQVETIDLDRRRARASDVTKALGRGRRTPTAPGELAQVQAVMAGVTDSTAGLDRPCRLLTAQASTLTRAQIMQALANAVDLSPPEVAAATEQLLARREVLPVLAAPGKGARPEARRYTTADLLATEEALVSGAVARVGQSCGKVPEAVIAAVEATRPELGEDQRTVLRQLLSSGDGVEVVIGPAGTGKTYLLDAAREAWTRTGYRVIGASLAALAAAGLEAGAGIPAVTIHRLLADLDRPFGTLEPGTVLVIDEGAMVGSRILERLARHAAMSGAKLVICGDHRQLPEIDAGGGFRLLAERLGAFRLETNRRQRQAWEAAALAQLRDGSVAEAVRAYDEAGRITIAESAEATRAAMIADWWALLAAGAEPAQVLLVAPTRAEVEDLGGRAQARLREAGRLGPPVLAAADGPLHRGDRIVATRNLPRAGVRNGNRGTVAHATIDGGLLVDFDGQGQTILPKWYVADHVRQGYALTAHRAQGATVEHTLLLGSDSIYRELGYSALSRGRDTNTVYLTISDGDADPPDPLDALARDLTISRGEQAATDAMPRLPKLGDPDQALAAWTEREAIAAALRGSRQSLQWPAEITGFANGIRRGRDRSLMTEPGDEGRGRTLPSAYPTEVGRSTPADRRPLIARHRELSAQLHMRERLLSHAVRWQRPAWATALLGPLPTSRRGEAAWLTAAGVAAAYRERWQVRGPGLGGPPRSDLQWPDWRAAQAAITRAHTPARPPTDQVEPRRPVANCVRLP